MEIKTLDQSTKTDPKKKRLRSEILETFSSTAYPGDDKIVPHQDGLDHEGVYEAFNGVDWQKVNWEWLKTHYSTPTGDPLLFMTPEAYRYYLPAYLLISIDSYDECDVLSDYIIYGLTAQKYEEYTPEDFRERITPLNDEAKSVVAKFLLYMYETYDNEDALIAYNGYWKKYYTPPERDRPSSQPA